MYIVFAFNYYYPEGGAADIRLVTDDLDEAVLKYEYYLRHNEHVEIYNVDKQAIERI
jgi:hypothetical protein